MKGFTKTGDKYVDSYYGNDSTGDGSKENPYASAGKAYTEASDYSIIICSGFFEEVLPLLGKNMTFEGDGFCLFSGASLVYQTIFDPSANITTINIIFANTNSGNAVFGSGGNIWIIINCQFYNCLLALSFEAQLHLSGSIFYNSAIELVMYYGGYKKITNNTFYNCTGVFDYTNLMVITNNHFEKCDTMTHDLPSVRNIGQEFNYNNIVGTLGESSNSDIQAIGDGNQYQMHGIASTTNQFNTDNSVLDDLTWWKSDFTLVSGSDNLNSAKDGKHIGAKSRGYRFSANDIWTAVDTSTNLEYDGTNAVIKRTDNSIDGDLTTNEMDLGANITTDILNLYQQLIDSAASSLTLVGKVDYNADPTPDNTLNQKITMDIELQYGTVSGSLSGWTKFEEGCLITVDGTGLGNADDNYDSTTATRITFRYFKIRLKLVS